ncbi:MAG: Uma2 family endonuclease [candidate division KSB1 bacterium]|nr:Uma2 family endonuclease [candidate division KSB1 bacterium]MDZ7367622.1 Uma2 family endonuclease [candidate division KSB1 bacterium]MDZ7405414.1 Uma2 family endonuclease [candidate division KSB1 bacterium]
MSIALVETIKPQTVGATIIANKDLSLEQRTDVTVDELEEMSLPVPAELYNGKVVFKMANPLHASIQLTIGGELYIYLKKNPIGTAFTEAHFKLWPDRNKEVRIPDVSFIVKERLPKDWLHYPAMAPDLAVEILSPTDSFEATMEKVDDYLRQGAQIVWVVITSTREVLVCTADGKHTVRDVLTAPNLLPGFELPVQTIFAGTEKQ